MLGRIAAPYHELETFDTLPTPFRTVAVDLVTARQVVLGRGALADAMRATMSLPLIFPPVAIDGPVLVDGGAMNNVPADIVKGTGADRVIAINVGDLSDRESLSYTLLGVAGSTLDAMMRSTTRASLAAAESTCRSSSTDRWPGEGPTSWSRRATRPPRRCVSNCCRLPSARPTMPSGVPAANSFWTMEPAARVFAFGAVGSTLEGEPPPTSEFGLGAAFRLGA